MTWDDLFRKRMRGLFGPWENEIDEMMKEMEKMFQESMKAFQGNFPSDLVRESKLPDGTIRREWGPFVYGYSVTIGPDGKPQIREFGNMQSLLDKEGRIALKEGREPMIDIISSGAEIKVVAELPGVNKEDIQIRATENELILQTGGQGRKYYKEIDLPEIVDPNSARSTYKNGILEVTFKRKNKGDSGVSIRVE
ncbi:MAG: archaeal heat shock protein Hsp20 [Nitrososphaerales archaeon]